MGAPERSDTFIVNLLNYRQKYHHDLKLKETLHAPRAEAFRVMFLGDSFTWGPASPEDSFPHQVEEMFQKGTVLGSIWGWPHTAPVSMESC